MRSLLVDVIHPTLPAGHLRGFLLLALVLLIVGALTIAGAEWVLARFILMPPRMTDGRALWILRRMSPDDLGLVFSPMRFIVEDLGTAQRTALHSWWIPTNAADPPSGRCVILLHGHADAKVGAIAMAPMLHLLGLNILALDLRAHGESGGRFSTGGFVERHDLLQVIDQLRAEKPEQTASLALMGVNLGANVALATAILLQQRPAEAAHPLAAVVLDGPTANYGQAVLRHAGALGISSRWLAKSAVHWAERMSKADFEAVNPVNLLQHIRGPLFLAQMDGDGFVSPRDGQALRAALTKRPTGSGETTFWQHAEAGDLYAPAIAQTEYQARLAKFLTAVSPGH